MKAASGNRKLIISMNMTMDGFMSGPNCELDWHFEFWTTEMAEFLGMQLQSADTLLLGRKTYQAMAQHWRDKELNNEIPLEDRLISYFMNSHRKIVFSNTITDLAWPNSRKLSGNLEPEITALKHTSGLNIIVYGSGQLTQALMNSGLVDEFHLWVHPLLLGDGKLLFKDISEFNKLELIEKKIFRSGVEAMFYRYRL